MNLNHLMQTERMGWRCVSVLALWMAAFAVSAADTNTPPVAATNAPPAAVTTAPPAATTNAPPATTTNAPEPEAEAPAPITPEQMFEGGTNSYSNWIEFGGGGFITGGNKSQFQQQSQARGGAFGGLEDFHFKKDIAKATTLTLDGRAMVDENDYKARIGVSKDGLGYVRFSYDQFRTWYNGDGGFFPPTGTYYGMQGDALALDRGQISFEAGLRMDKVPKITFKYTRTYREGDKSSTSWGGTHPTGSTPFVRGLAPSFYDINEHSDLFELDATHHIKATDLGLGLRYETGKLDDALKIDQYPGEPTEQKITNRQGTTYDLFNVHSFSESWIKKNLMISSGLAYSDLDNDWSGSRVYGNAFDVGYLPNPLASYGYYNLNGGSHLHEYVGNLNLFYQPVPHLSIVPSVRVQKEDTDASATGMETVGTAAPLAFDGGSDQSDLDVRERLDLSYNGITNWVFYARGELSEGNGNLYQRGGLVPIPPYNGIPQPAGNYHSDQDRFFQKYSAGARWYPLARLTFDAGGYYKRDKYNYNNTVDGNPNTTTYPGFLVLQSFDTYDGNFRMTVRPRMNISAVSRYEFQYSTIHTTPDPTSGLTEAGSSKMTSHILAQDVTWTPWSRLYLSGGFNYVLSTTKTPASDATAAILEAENNYWTVNFSTGLVLDDKTDLKVSYFYYQSDNYQDISLNGVPYGAGAQQHGITATLTRRITQNLRWNLKYGFSHYHDELSGGNQDFNAHLVYTSLQVPVLI